MTAKTLLVLALGMTPCLSNPAAAAAPGPKARIFAKYDTNKNGAIDGDEIAAIRDAFKADSKGEFARYDTNRDGKLDDAEVAEIKPPGQSGKKRSGGKRKSESNKK
jgi:DNA-binding transcriptional regulator YiaG